MDIYLDLFLLATIIVSIVDISGFIDTVKHWIWRWLHGNKPYVDFDFRPFECSYCSMNWIGLLYLIIVGELSIVSYAYVLFLCMLTPIIKDIMILIRDICASIIEAIYTVFHI